MLSALSGCKSYNFSVVGLQGLFISDLPEIAVSIPSVPALENSTINITCNMTDGFPYWLENVTWLKDGETLDIGKYSLIYYNDFYLTLYKHQ